MICWLCYGWHWSVSSPGHTSGNVGQSCRIVASNNFFKLHHIFSFGEICLVVLQLFCPMSQLMKAASNNWCQYELEHNKYASFFAYKLWPVHIDGTFLCTDVKPAKPSWWWHHRLCVCMTKTGFTCWPGPRHWGHSEPATFISDWPGHCHLGPSQPHHRACRQHAQWSHAVQDKEDLQTSPFCE